MNQTKLDITLKEIVFDYKIHILKDKQQLLAVFEEYCPDAPEEREKLRLACEYDIAEQLMQAPTDFTGATIACKKAIRSLLAQANIPEDLATEIVCTLADVLRLQYDIEMDTSHLEPPVVVTKPIEEKKPVEPPKPVAKPVESKKPVEVKKPEKPQPNKKNPPVSPPRPIAQASAAKAAELSTWIPGSGIGYSTHQNPVYPGGMCRDLSDQIRMDFSPSEAVAHAATIRSLRRQIKKQQRIAGKLWHARRFSSLYDAAVLDGAQSRPFARKYKRYNSKYIRKLESKLW